MLVCVFVCVCVCGRGGMAGDSYLLFGDRGQDGLHTVPHSAPPHFLQDAALGVRRQTECLLRARDWRAGRGGRADCGRAAERGAQRLRREQQVLQPTERGRGGGAAARSRRSR